MTPQQLLISAIAAGTLVACAAAPESGDDGDPMEDARVGEKVDRICFSGGINGFSEWDKGRDGLILRRGVNDQYLATFAGSCPPAADAQRIGLDDRFGGGCLSRGDSIFVSSRMFSGGAGQNPFDSQKCIVNGIYKWDEDAAMDESN